MRFYRIDLSNAVTGAPILLPSLGGLALTSLLPGGGVNPAALNIEFDIPVTNYTPGHENKQAFLRVWGIGLKDLTNALNLTPPSNKVNVKIAAGMSAGLPLANPAQQGLIMSGSVIQAFGNWVGVDQTLDFIFAATVGGAAITPGAKTFPFTWLAGTPLNAAIAATLSTAFPYQKQIINISPRLILNHDEHGIYTSLETFTTYLNGITRPIIGGTYQGIGIVSNGQTVTVYDTTQPPKNPVKAIAFQDLVGQPTWIDPNTISVKFVMRGDLTVADVISLPQSLVTQSQQSFLNFQDKTAFTGNYIIQEVEHFGNFRQSDAASWATVVVAVAQPKSTNA